MWQTLSGIWVLKGVGSNRKRQKIKLMALQRYWQMELYFFYFFFVNLWSSHVGVDLFSNEEWT